MIRTYKLKHDRDFSTELEQAKDQHAVIKLENLSGIRNSKKHTRSFNYSPNSWPFHQLQQFIEYKAKLQGISVAYAGPAYTSQRCSRCGTLGNRNGKEFSCPTCGHTGHADANAAFKIALAQDVSRSAIERDMAEGGTDAPQNGNGIGGMPTIKPHYVSGGSMSEKGRKSVALEIYKCTGTFH